jgi:hypothetical protein
VRWLVAYRGIVAHWRAIILLLIFALVTFLIAHADFFDLFVLALLLIFIASQLFWIGRILDIGERFIPGKSRRVWLAIAARGLVWAYALRPDLTHATIFRAVGPAALVTALTRIGK